MSNFTEIGMTITLSHATVNYTTPNEKPLTKVGEMKKNLSILIIFRFKQTATTKSRVYDYELRPHVSLLYLTNSDSGNIS